MSPFLSTATVMFSGFVCVGIFTAVGKSTFTVLLITGMVMRKMINSTNMTSTRGVVLMFAITPGSSLPDGGPTLIDIIVAPLTRPARHTRGTDRARAQRAAGFKSPRIRLRIRNYLRIAAAGAALGRA